MATTKILTSISELKAHIAIDFVKDFGVISYAIEERENWLRDEYLGDVLFDELAAYKVSADESSSSSSGSSSTENPLQDLLYYAQRAVSNLAFMDYIPEGQLNISEKGIRIATNEEMKTAFDWQIKNLEQKYKHSGYNAIENMIILLARNLSSFSSWSGTIQHTALMGMIIWSAKDFNKYMNISESRIAFRELVPAIKKAEQFYLVPSIGQTYYDALITKVKANNAGGDDLAIINMIKPALVHLAVYMAMNEYGIDFSGLFEESPKKRAQANQVQIESAEKFGNAYLQKLIDYLDENATASKYVEYYNYSQESNSYSVNENRFFDNDDENGIFVM